MQNKELEANNLKLNSVIADLNNNLSAAGESIKVLTNGVEKKQEDILILEEEINYLKVEGERSRTHGK